MWRNALGGSRDMYLATSRDGVTFPTPQKLGNGTWKLNACPMDGGGLAVSSSKILTAWRRETNVFLAEPGEPEKQVGTGKDVALALSGNRTYVAWVDGTKVEAWIDGNLEQLAENGAFPSLRPPRRRSARRVGGKRRHSNSPSAVDKSATACTKRRPIPVSPSRPLRPYGGLRQIVLDPDTPAGQVDVASRSDNCFEIDAKLWVK